MLYWWCVALLCVVTATYGVTEVKKCVLVVFTTSWFDLLADLSLTINYWKGTLGGFPKFISKLPVKDYYC